MKVSGSGAPVDARTLIERQIRRWDRLAAVLEKKSGGQSLAEASQRPVLTVSGSTGSGRERLAMALCKDLDYELFGRELLEAVASDLSCQRRLVESLDEKVQSNISLRFESWLRGRDIENRDYIRALFRVMETLASEGGAVILGRGGAFVLGDKAALRVRVVAPLEKRVARIADGWKIGEEEARRIVETKDQEQREFCRHYFQRDVGDPSAFDLTINTQRFEPEKAVGLVRAALAERGIEIQSPAV